MTPNGMKDTLRRQLQDSTAVIAEATFESDSILFGYLNSAVQIVQLDVQRAQPNFFVRSFLVSTVLNQTYYTMPDDFQYELRAELKLSSSGSYSGLKHLPDDAGRDGVLGTLGSNPDPSQFRYSRLGQYIGLWPAPPASVAQGLRVLYVPWLTLAVRTVDAEFIPIPSVLHSVIVLWAKILAIGETYEESKEAKELIGAAMDRFFSAYRHSAQMETFDLSSAISRE